MRYLAILGIAVSLFANVYLFSETQALYAERTKMIEELNTLRNADNIAILSEQRMRQSVADRARRQRDELGKIDSTMSIDDLLSQCRRGMFGAGTCANSDSTRSIDNVVPTTESTGRPERGE